MLVQVASDDLLDKFNWILFFMQESVDGGLRIVLQHIFELERQGVVHD